MKINHNTKSTGTELIASFFILLFIYAAVSKILDFETFRVQLGQSPILSAFADLLVYLVPVLEVGIALLLSSKKYRYRGLLLAFGLMVIFTTYIIIILNYSPFIPCSCGGILTNMNWNQHLIFNTTVTFLAPVGIVLCQTPFDKSKQSKYLNYQFCVKHAYVLQILCITILCAFSVILLFIFSEKEIHRNNAFVRRYPQHPVTEMAGIPLKYNSYYIAGFSKGKIFLGNKTAPLQLLSFDKNLQHAQTIPIVITDNKKYPFESVQVIVKNAEFFIYDGSIPILYKGNTNDWKAKTVYKGHDVFSLLIPTTPNNFVIRANKESTGENILATYNLDHNGKVKYYQNILKKKIDGVFDTDGKLLYNEKLKKVIYSYYYRNTFTYSNSDLQQTQLRKTIDTMSMAPLDFAYLKDKKEKKFAKEPILVQKFATTSGKYLFVKSARLGKYESEKMLKDASIIDVYDLEKNTYEFSFYLYNYKNEEINSFAVYGNKLFGLTSKSLIKCELKPKYFKIL